MKKIAFLLTVTISILFANDQYCGMSKKDFEYRVQGYFAKIIASITMNINPKSGETLSRELVSRSTIHISKDEYEKLSTSDKSNYMLHNGRYYRYKGFAFGPNNIHRAFIQDTTFGIVVGFSGTDGWRDWANYLTIKRENYGGQDDVLIWSVFDDASSILSNSEFVDTLRYYYTHTSNKDIYIVGHSKGGAAAYISTFKLKDIMAKIDSNYNFDPYIYTFGAPKPGNAGFEQIYNKSFPKTYSYRLKGDIVPFLIPSSADSSINSFFNQNYFILKEEYSKLLDKSIKLGMQSFPVGYSIVNKPLLGNKWSCDGKTLHILQANIGTANIAQGVDKIFGKNVSLDIHNDYLNFQYYK